MFFTLSLSKWNISQEKIPVSLLHSLLIMVHKFNPHHSCYIFPIQGNDNSRAVAGRTKDVV